MIEVVDLTKKFGEEEVLHGVNYCFEKGKVHGIIGNNGSGKTILFKCICGFIKPTEGKVVVDGKVVGRDMDFPENIGIIIETPGFIPYLSGLRNLLILAAMNNKISKEQVKEVLIKVGLEPSLKKPVAKYSLGMRQRLGIAQAIMEDPQLLILDEPFNGLDKNGVSEIRGLIQNLKHEGKTILLASHNKDDIDILCDTVCEMDGGYIKRCV